MGSVTQFRKEAKKDLRTNIDGLEILSNLKKNLDALTQIDEELENAIHDFERDVMDDEGNIIRTEVYRSTTLDRETIAVYHARQAGRKMQIDAQLRILNKVLPDLKAVEKTKDINDKAAMALAAFAAAASEE